MSRYDGPIVSVLDHESRGQGWSCMLGVSALCYWERHFSKCLPPLSCIPVNGTGKFNARANLAME